MARRRSPPAELNQAIRGAARRGAARNGMGRGNAPYRSRFLNNLTAAASSTATQMTTHASSAGVGSPVNTWSNPPAPCTPAAAAMNASRRLQARGNAPPQRVARQHELADGAGRGERVDVEHRSEPGQDADQPNEPEQDHRDGAPVTTESRVLSSNASVMSTTPSHAR